ncbi:MAG: heme ABC exporter ATP-binding protein CcmA [Chloroflexi bacterium]|nr:heme ABC exporter ATP-binding protein CcmA [Chloroflexota bacterium]
MVTTATRQAQQTVAPAIWTRGVSKTFGHFRALRGIDLSVERGEFVVLFGPNGAGKTTFLRILAGLSKPTAGRVILDGSDLAADPGEVRRKIGVISHQTFVYDDLTAEENLRFFGQMFDVPRLGQRVAEVLAQVGLSRRAHDRARTFSRGMQQRLSIARAVLHNPPILLLDEPDTGLDERAAEMLHAVIRGLEGEKRSVLLTTHHFERGLAMASRVCLLAEGRLVLDRPRAELTPDLLRQEFARLAGGKA